jgi:polysaccharide deacetylase family protein (PEP-CTERM system associated)
MERLANFLTLDIEEWYHANYDGFDADRYAGVPTKLEAVVERLIGLFGEHGVRTTAFVLGSVAREKPAIVRKLRAAGHEIASHGYGHERVYAIGRARFASDIELASKILEDITGRKTLGYRAPSFSVTRECLGWFYDVLEEHGFAYSSSVFPGRTFLYGVPGFPELAHAPVVEGRRRRIMEYPLPVVRLASRQMGLYLRLFPTWMILRRIERDNRAGRPVVLYAHPREMDPYQPRLNLPAKERLIHYWGLRGFDNKISKLLAKVSFARIADSLPPAGVTFP